jgi:signal transduction histidine kinase
LDPADREGQVDLAHWVDRADLADPLQTPSGCGRRVSPLSPDFEPTLKQQLQTTLGTAYQVSIQPTADASKRAIPIPTPFFDPRDATGVRLFDISVGFPDGDSAVFRIGHLPRGAPLSRNLFFNLALLVVLLVIALYVTARSITRPLSKLVSAAEGLGRNVRQPKLEEKGARELRDAARAFNTMQDRLQRYLDSRTRVLAAMSHDLKTPLTRLRLQVETTLDDSAIQARFGKELDEMESMVRGALALFRGLDDDETLAQIDINALVATLQSEFTEMGADVTVEGQALQPFMGKPQALRRCLTNLVANAVKFGTRAKIVVEDGTALLIRVRDEGPGIPPDELERVFEPFYRVESSRNRDTGGTGLGLSIARDVAQAHGGSLVAQNLPAGGLEALLVLPRRI